MTVKSQAWVMCAVLVLAVAGTARAQEFRATIRGQIVDTSKAAVPGATVTMTEHGNQRGRRDDEQCGGELHDSFPQARLVHT